MLQDFKEKGIRTYGRKVGRPLSPSKQEALARVLPEVDLSRQPWPRPLWMEIGFGFGEHLLEWLTRHPQKGIIGVEVFKNGVAHLAAHLPPQDYGRCRIFPHPVAQLFPLLGEKMVEGIMIFFPDPWPKHGHHKRRLIQRAFLDQCYRVLEPGGQIHLATDNLSLMEWMLDHFKNHEGFIWKAGVADPDPRTWPQWPEDCPLSRYRQKALSKGRVCGHMIWEKEINNAQ